MITDEDREEEAREQLVTGYMASMRRFRVEDNPARPQESTVITYGIRSALNSVTEAKKVVRSTRISNEAQDALLVLETCRVLLDGFIRRED